MSLITIIIVLGGLNHLQLVHSFLWKPFLAAHSSVQASKPPVLDGQATINTPFARGISVLQSQETFIEYQSDDKYDRGDMHISAAVDEGDTVVYRTGSWYVDGVLVGDDEAVPAYEFCRVETIQVVWTHNCEHGVLRGLAVDFDENDKASLSLRTPLEDIQFGPEQIIARICNVNWEPKHDNDDDAEIGTSSIPLYSSMWKEHDANAI